ncbi:MAG: hypothetical protein ACRDZV_05625, partial [Acidimicrobiia bacterium]
RRRRARRRAATGLALATVVVTALATTVVVVDRERGSDGPRVAADGTAPSTTTTTPPPTTSVPPEVVDQAQQDVVAAAPSGFAVEPGNVTVVAPDEAIATVTDTTGASYDGVRFARDASEWKMTEASTCRLPGADPAACAGVPPEVLFAPGNTPLGPDAYSGRAATTTPVALTPDPGYLPGPLLATDDGLVTAAHDREGSTYTEFPSHVVRIAPDTGAVTPQAELDGLALSLAEGEGALWAVTRDERIDTDRVEYRLKRIGPEGRATTMPIPPGRVPAGDVVAGSGGIWIPIRDGVLVYNPLTGRQFETHLLPPEQEQRGIALFGDAVYVTYGGSLRRIDGDTTPDDPIDTGSEWPLIDLVATPDAMWALAANGHLFRVDVAAGTAEQLGTIPPELRDPELHSDGTQAWIAGEADLAPATSPSDAVATSLAVEPVALLLDRSGIAATVVLAGATDAVTAFMSAGELAVTSGGSLYRVTLPE